MKHKTSELTGTALDVAVAMIDPQCEGLTFKTVRGVMCGVDSKDGLICIYFLPDGRAITAIRTRHAIREIGGEHARSYSPSTDWAAGGPLIEREQISAICDCGNWMALKDASLGMCTSWEHQQEGPDALTAAMRCYVLSKLGDTVDIPD